MIRKPRTPASRNPSTMCCKTGLPRTSIIGLGRSDVSSRIRVPRPAASKTALSILVTSFCLASSRDVVDKRLGEHRPPACSIRPLRRMHLHKQNERSNRFAASCRELQVHHGESFLWRTGSLCSPEIEDAAHHSLFFGSLTVRAGKLACLINSLTFGTSSFFSCAHFFNCSSSCVLNVWKTSSCGLVGSVSPRSIAWLNVSNRSFSIFGKARFPSEPFMFT